MPRKPRADDEDAWIDQHLGEAAMGSIVELRTVEPQGKQFQKVYGPLGFCIDPAAYRQAKRRPRKSVRSQGKSSA